MKDRKTVIRIAGVLFIMLYVSYCYFLQNPSNWNSVPRIALVLSIIEDGKLTINEYRKATGDIAVYKRQFYSDKAPGMALMAVPVVAAARPFIKSSFPEAEWLNESGRTTLYFALIQQIANMFTTAIFMVLAALTIYFLALRLGAGLSGAVFGALAYGLATPAWGWATAFFGHNPAGACLIMGFAAVYYIAVPPGGVKKDVLLGFAAGALLSWAVVIEIPSAPASAIIGLFGIYSARTWEKRRIIRVFMPGLVGALVFISPMLVYNYMITGSPFGSLYSYTLYYSGMRKGIFGLTSLEPSLILKLLFTPGHGLFWLSPVLLTAPYAFYKLWKTPGAKPVAVTLAAVPLYYLLMNSSYEYWTGGGSTGPRYLTPMLPFLCLPLAVMWSGAGKRFRAVLLGLFSISFLISLASVSFSMTKEISRDINILTGYIIPGFLEGERFQINAFRVFLPDSLKPFLKGQTALMPLYVVLAMCGAYIVRLIRRPEIRN